MTTTGYVAVVAIVFGAVVSLAVGSLHARVTRRTSDFLVASRTVRPATNAAAISGEYLSAASFLGVAGIILQDGADALWYPIGFTAGHLALALFVVAPLRRSGAYTVPDFAEARLRSPALRRLCTAVVIVVGWLYLLPQFQGAGLTVAILTTGPAWYGVAAAGVLVVAAVVLGGMRSVTFLRAFQYWVKLTALLVPAVLALIFFLHEDRAVDRSAPPRFPDRTTVEIRADVVLQVGHPVVLSASGLVDGVPAEGAVRWEPGRHTVTEGSELTFPGGAHVPVVVGSAATGDVWLQPFTAAGHGLLATYSLVIATFLGTMGLPHVLVRFYTNPDGRAARRSAVGVLGLVGGFYVIAMLLGVLSRVYTPQLLITGDTDAAVLLVPSAVMGSGWLGEILGGFVATGAWVAFLSTSSGLVVGVAGVMSAEVLPGRLRDFRLATLIATGVPLVLALGVTRLDFVETVSLVFAVAASTFCPLLVLGIWWRGLTDAGAIAGMAVGGVLSTGAVIASLAGAGGSDWAGVLLHRPAVVSVPAAFVTMVVVSLFTARRRPVEAEGMLLRLHAPDRLGLSVPRGPEYRKPRERPDRIVVLPRRSLVGRLGAVVRWSR